MKVIIEEIPQEQEEEILLRCHEVSAETLTLLNRLKAAGTPLLATRGEEIRRLQLKDIFYFEVVDGKSFFYCEREVYESRLRLYEFEEICQGTAFFRAAKSMVLNADKIESIKPSLSGRFDVTLLNHEKVVVSRQYVGVLKKLMGV